MTHQDVILSHITSILSLRVPFWREIDDQMLRQKSRKETLAIVCVLVSFLDDGIPRRSQERSHLSIVFAMVLKYSPLASQVVSMQIDLHIALPEASAVMGSVVLVVRRSNGVDGSIDVIDQIDGFAWCLYICMGS